jgi:hypothetical protein
MDVEEFRTKPSWKAYEATLLTKGFHPPPSATVEAGKDTPRPVSCETS